VTATTRFPDPAAPVPDDEQIGTEGVGARDVSRRGRSAQAERTALHEGAAERGPRCPERLEGVEHHDSLSWVDRLRIARIADPIAVTVGLCAGDVRADIARIVDAIAVLIMSDRGADNGVGTNITQDGSIRIQ